ncbi:unnamed protein product [Adineta ricciae]|uniref:Uncharacterized protein n=1 Tax=Adineta ricciae TaxID=249248 RepID=A0A814G382_ADIRI|nr:unnamed protein product [Adineta ricciae]
MKFQLRFSSPLPFVISVGNTLAIRCYTGTDRQCILSPNTNDCGENETCVCAKYRFQCAANDQACTQHEQTVHMKKWGYVIIEWMQSPSDRPMFMVATASTRAS